MQTADHYRDKAAEMLGFADRDAVQRDHWLKMAVAWESLARQVDEEERVFRGYSFGD
jgi:hypothetical protein